MTNYTPLRTCAAAGENYAIRLWQAGQPVVFPGGKALLGPDASFDQCMACEWAFIAAEIRLTQDRLRNDPLAYSAAADEQYEAMRQYAQSRVRDLVG